LVEASPIVQADCAQATAFASNGYSLSVLGANNLCLDRTGADGHALLQLFRCNSIPAAQRFVVNATLAPQARPGDDSSGCPNQGHLTWTLVKDPAYVENAANSYGAITAAMTSAVDFYNCHTDFTKNLSVRYDPSVPTAESGVYGGELTSTISFGANAVVINRVTAMHEIAHALGVGGHEYAVHSVNGLFIGDKTAATLSAITHGAQTTLHSDGTHFWPYGLNSNDGFITDSDLVAHCQLVRAIRADLGW
jgi:hypothetical protein